MLISSANVYGDQGRFCCQLEEPRHEKTCVLDIYDYVGQKPTCKCSVQYQSDHTCRV